MGWLRIMGELNDQRLNAVRKQNGQLSRGFMEYMDW